ncbi:unnamed protein product [Protopolystoma xenopodis]|uniref:Uncharacterized protein n=1 Tax=Protopolystoma xenopodis TaxID=117903 RepID=A0A448WFJ6_9PLAT|nr:unnamed protein product [Protopolystoma xenopodis]
MLSQLPLLSAEPTSLPTNPVLMQCHYYYYNPSNGNLNEETNRYNCDGLGHSVESTLETNIRQEGNSNTDHSSASTFGGSGPCHSDGEPTVDWYFESLFSRAPSRHRASLNNPDTADKQAMGHGAGEEETDLGAEEIRLGQRLPINGFQRIRDMIIYYAVVNNQLTDCPPKDIFFDHGGHLSGAENELYSHPNRRPSYGDRGSLSFDLRGNELSEEPNGTGSGHPLLSSELRNKQPNLEADVALKTSFDSDPGLAEIFELPGLPEIPR